MERQSLIQDKTRGNTSLLISGVTPLTLQIWCRQSATSCYITFVKQSMGKNNFALLTFLFIIFYFLCGVSTSEYISKVYTFTVYFPQKSWTFVNNFYVLYNLIFIQAKWKDYFILPNTLRSKDVSCFPVNNNYILQSST